MPEESRLTWRVLVFFFPPLIKPDSQGEYKEEIFFIFRVLYLYRVFIFPWSDSQYKLSSNIN